MGTDEELQSLRRQLETHKKNLSKLEEQAATYGIAVPLHLSNQIDHEKEKITHIEEQIAQLKETRSSFTKVFEAAGPVQAIRQLVEATRGPGIEARYYGCHTPGQDANIKLYIEKVDVGLVRLEFIDSEEKTQGTITAKLKAAQMALAESWWSELLRLLTEAGRFPSARSGIMEDTESKKESPTMVSESHSLPQYDYDVALSFAGEDREYVEQVAEILKKRHVCVFYDKFEEIDLWGKDLYVHLDEVYRLKARYCVMFISKHYARKLWTNHERRSAQARAFQENKEYLLPARFDDTEIPGIRPTVGYVDLRITSSSQLAEKVIAKLEQSSSSVTRSAQRADRLRELTEFPNHISECLEQSGYSKKLGQINYQELMQQPWGYRQQESIDVAPAQSWVSFVACPLEVPHQSSTEVIAIAKQLFNPRRWNGRYHPGPRSWGPGVLSIRNGKGRTTRGRFEWTEVYPDHLKTELLRKYLIVWGSGCLEYGMTYPLMFESGQAGQVFFRFVPLIGLFWRFLCAVREFEDEIDYEGESFICLNMVNTKDSFLLDFAEGWGREPYWESFVPEVNP